MYHSHSNLSQLIYNGNRTEWTPIRSVIIRVISNSNWTEWSTIQGSNRASNSKSDEREARGRFEITNAITP